MKGTVRIVAAALLAALALGVMALSAPAITVSITPGGFTPPPIKVAVVYSQTTLDWANKRGTPSRYPHGSKEKKLVEYLRARGYDVTELVGDRDLTNTQALKQYNVIVLNSMYGMGYPASYALARYVDQGGGLVATIGSPRVNPAYAPPKGVKDHLNEWWWRVMGERSGLHLWEWGPLSSLYAEAFVNDGAYTPEWTLKPNPNSPVIQQARDILGARGYNNDLSSINLHHPGANLEMSLKLAGASDASSSADFNILTPSVKRLYPKNYSAIMAAPYGAGRVVKFDYGATDFLPNYCLKLYSPTGPGGYPQGEVGGALVEAAIVWAGTADGTIAHSIDGTTCAVVSATSKKVTAKQTVTNRSNTLTRGTIRFAIYSPTGKTLKSWAAKNIQILPHRTLAFSYVYGRALPSGMCKVVATFNYGYPAENRIAVSQAAIYRGQKLTTK
jgi:hypothetical protein